MQPHHQINNTNVNEWTVLTNVTLTSSNCTLPDDGDNTETCWSCFNVNFNILLEQLFCASVGNHHHHKHPVLGHSARSVSRVTVVLSIVSSVSQLFSFLVGCSEMILKGFGFLAFFAGVKASSFCVHLSCLICCLSVGRGEWSRLFCGHKKTNDSIRRELQTDNISW
jgi:hypothetical protein